MGFGSATTGRTTETGRSKKRRLTVFSAVDLLFCTLYAKHWNLLETRPLHILFVPCSSCHMAVRFRNRLQAFHKSAELSDIQCEPNACPLRLAELGAVDIFYFSPPKAKAVPIGQAGSSSAGCRKSRACSTVYIMAACIYLMALCHRMPKELRSLSLKNFQRHRKAAIP